MSIASRNGAPSRAASTSRRRPRCARPRARRPGRCASAERAARRRRSRGRAGARRSGTRSQREAPWRSTATTCRGRRCAARRCPDAAPRAHPIRPSRRGSACGAGRAFRVGGDLVDALPELGVGVGREPRADALVGRPEGHAAVLAQVVAAGRDAQVHPVPVAQDRVHAQPAVAGLPLAGVLVVADARHHLPGVAAVGAPEQRRRLDACQQVLLVRAHFMVARSLLGPSRK
jgi:hypothetical protein